MTLFQKGEFIRVPFGQTLREVVDIKLDTNGDDQWYAVDISTGNYTAKKWYFVIELDWRNGKRWVSQRDAWEGAQGSTAPASEDANAYPRPVRAATLTAADTWDGDPANTTAPADENSYPRKPFTVVRLPAEKLQVGDVLIGDFDKAWGYTLQVVGIQKLVGNTAARHFTFDEGGKRYGEQVFNRKWYQVRRNAA